MTARPAPLHSSRFRLSLTGSIAVTALLAGCASQRPAAVVVPAPATYPAAIANPRLNGAVGQAAVEDMKISLAAPGGAVRSTATSASIGPGGAVTLDFANADIRDIASQVLGDILGVNYAIDPGVKGSATLRTVQPISRRQALETLQATLAENGARLTYENGTYRVALEAGSVLGGGGEIVPLRYVTAADLIKLLQPLLPSDVKVTAADATNALVLTGPADGRESVRQTIQAFDVDILSGQSYALLPTGGESAREFAAALREAMQAQGGAALAGAVDVVAMPRLESVLLIARDSRYIAEARRIETLLNAQTAQSTRNWHVYYLQNSRANDTAYLLQEAFTPDHVTAVPSETNTAQVTARTAAGLASASGANGTGNAPAGNGVNGNAAGSGATQVNAAALLAGGDSAASGAADTSGGDENNSGDGSSATQRMRVIPSTQNNAVLVYATEAEQDTVEAMLRKIDILPLQVRIDATIAEVTLNDNLLYGTQYWFKSAGPLTQNSTGINSFLANVFSASNNFTGFLVKGTSSAQIALDALQAVTNVKVLSSPEVLVLDNQTASLQVGADVPILSSSSQSTVANSAVINSIEYRQTGVLTQVTPRVNSGGLVTLDLDQEVTDEDNSINTAGISSPAFQQRAVRSRVEVQDGQTVGIAGLIRDTTSTGNQGIPYLKDVPVLGALFGQQNNTRTRTELLVLVTPHVIQDQRDIANLTADLQENLSGAAAVPDQLNRLPQSGSSFPAAQWR